MHIELEIGRTLFLWLTIVSIIAGICVMSYLGGKTDYDE